MSTSDVNTRPPKRAIQTETSAKIKVCCLENNKVFYVGVSVFFCFFSPFLFGEAQS